MPLANYFEPATELREREREVNFRPCRNPSQSLQITPVSRQETFLIWFKARSAIRAAQKSKQCSVYYRINNTFIFSQWITSHWWVTLLWFFFSQLLNGKSNMVKLFFSPYLCTVPPESIHICSTRQGAKAQSKKEELEKKKSGLECLKSNLRRKSNLAWKLLFANILHLVSQSRRKFALTNWRKFQNLIVQRS